MSLDQRLRRVEAAIDSEDEAAPVLPPDLPDLIIAARRSKGALNAMVKPSPRYTDGKASLAERIAQGRRQAGFDMPPEQRAAAQAAIDAYMAKRTARDRPLPITEPTKLAPPTSSPAPRKHAGPTFLDVMRNPTGYTHQQMRALISEQRDAEEEAPPVPSHRENPG